MNIVMCQETFGAIMLLLGGFIGLFLGILFHDVIINKGA
jgi:hypothetical protein